MVESHSQFGHFSLFHEVASETTDFTHLRDGAIRICSKAFLDISIDRAPRGCMITGCIRRVRHEHNIRHCFVVNIHDITDYGKQVLKK
jgi:hypothetical protein